VRIDLGGTGNPMRGFSSLIALLKGHSLQLVWSA